MSFCTGPTLLTAERFSSSIVLLVRSNCIRTVDLFSAVEDPDRNRLTITAQLTSALSWKHHSTHETRGAADSLPDTKHETSTDGTVFRYHISFLHTSTGTEPWSVRGAESSHAPQVRLTAWWCAELQRQLAICSALTGNPTRLSVSLLPFVPALTWERGSDGILGAMHCAVMSSTIEESELETQQTPVSECALDKESVGCGVKALGTCGGERSGRQYTLQAALLLNANIPLGPRAMKSTAVLVLHAPDGDLCTAQSAHVFSSASLSQTNLTSVSLPLSQQQKKIRREVTQSRDCDDAAQTVKSDACRNCNVNDFSGCPKDSFYTLLSQFTTRSLLPALSWSSVWSHARFCELAGERNASNSEDPLSRNENQGTVCSANDVCGLGKQIGCSYYLDGHLDPRRVRSITVILNIPRALWYRLLPWLRCDGAIESLHTSGTQRVPLSHDMSLLKKLWEQFPQRVAETVEGALTRLAAENLDCFLRCPAKPCMTDSTPATQAAEGENCGDTKVQQSWQLLAQSIAESLAQIVRASQNPVFVEEVYRLLQPMEREDTEIGAAFASDTKLSSSSPATTAALLRWAVETRLAES